MNKELFDSMNKQMTPSPQVRAELSEKLARPAKKRPVPWKKYTALAACAVLVIGVYAVYQVGKPRDQPLISQMTLHSYVTVEGMTGYVTETAAENLETGGGTNTGDLPNRDSTPSGDLPGGTYVGDIPVQVGAEDYQLLMAQFNGAYPDWYGGAYLDSSGRLVVQLVESQDPGDKSLELQILDWTGSDTVMFSSCKYSLSYLRDLQDKVCDAMIELGLFSSCGTDEERNRLELILTDVTDGALAILAGLDPDDDAIYVQVGQRAVADVGTEEPAVSHVVPGGATVPEDDGNLIADEPVYDGALYDVEDLPEELPEQKQPAFQVDSAPNENISTPAYDPDAGFTSPKS